MLLNQPFTLNCSSFANCEHSNSLQKYKKFPIPAKKSAILCKKIFKNGVLAAEGVTLLLRRRGDYYKSSYASWSLLVVLALSI